VTFQEPCSHDRLGGGIEGEGAVDGRVDGVRRITVAMVRWGLNDVGSWELVGVESRRVDILWVGQAEG
jgi:hypothetical protein